MLRASAAGTEPAGRTKPRDFVPLKVFPVPRFEYRVLGEDEHTIKCAVAEGRYGA
jgi:hypothetical protein